MQNLFLSHHFDNKIEPVVKSIKQIIASHDLEILDGKRLQGQLLLTAVKDRIAESDAVIIFLSKREAGKTDDWVQHERTTAQVLGKPFLAIIEKGLTNASPFGSFEYKVYDPNDLAQTLIDISEVIYGWKLTLGEKIVGHVDSEEIAEEVRENYDQKDIVQYRLLKRNGYSDWKEAFVVKESGGVSLRLEGVPKDAELQLRVTANRQFRDSDVMNRNVRFKFN